MNDLQWECHRFERLTNQQLYAILKLRADVFVVEQQCAYADLDNKDLHNDTHHLFACTNGHPVAYSRLLPPGLSYPEVSIGRFVVSANLRKQGVGISLLQKSLYETSRLWPASKVKISAQAHLKEFYEKSGFKQISAVYVEDGIPHIHMLKP